MKEKNAVYVRLMQLYKWKICAMHHKQIIN
jgi:hypothetical protein